MTARGEGTVALRPGMAAGQRGLDPVGRALVRQGILSSRSLFEMEARVERAEVRLPDALRLTLDLPPEDIARAEAEVARTQVVDPLSAPPEKTLVAALGPDFCARHGVLPWRRVGGQVVVLTSRPDAAQRIGAEMTEKLGPVSLAVTTEAALNAALQRCAGPALVRQAESWVAPELSCRGWSPTRARTLALAALAGLITGFVLAPATTFAVVSLWAIFTLVMFSAIKAATLWHFLRGPGRPARTPSARPLRRPTVSILVPLYREREIAAHLIRRLQRIDYPHELLDICLVLEADDAVTRATISGTSLPPWIRAFSVPPGTLKTKPRALNYALNFARGSIIGIYDAEDAPAPDQIDRVVARFAAAPPEVACLQGMLDYYNSQTNWLARCFTLEYATWFRVMLPGLQRLGLVIPLGGTTLFLRRHVIEKLGGWDAHNVTEDADLGIRLARAGYRTELIATVTEEEANCHAWPWVKQRSRWLKGYGLTYCVHMRNPARLWQELGAWRFFGLQVHFLGTLSQVLFAPFLWSFWALPFGLPHPVTGVLGAPALWTIGGLFLTCEALNIATAALAVRAAGKPELMGWAPTLHLYFPLACIAAYKGLGELLRRPFYWDKTRHGLYLPHRVTRLGRKPAPVPKRSRISR